VDRLIIRHGDRVTEHEIGEHPLIIGRDPQCDLFFADKKLSRRHARFERDGKEVRLVDLGSRNGSWVNDERVETRLVTAGDSMRLGSLLISLFEESEPEPEEDSTVYLPAEAAAADESGTVMLSPEVLSAAASGGSEHDAGKAAEDAGSDESGTVMLSPDVLSAAAAGVSGHDASKAAEDDAGSDESGTVMLPSEALSAAASGGSGHDANEAIEGAGDAATMMLPTTDTLRPPEHENAPGGPEEPEDEIPTLYRPESGSTVILESATPLKEAKTGAVIFRGQVDPSLAAATRIVSPESLRESLDETGDESVSEELSSANETRASGRNSPGSFRFVALVAMVSILAVAVLALPLMRTLGSAVTSESSLRARALVYLLAATNVAALSQSPPGARSLEHVVDEPGVVGAYILDRSGNVVAPEGGDVSSLPRGALRDAVGLAALMTRDLANGDVLIMTPIAEDGRLFGVAVLQFRPSTVTSLSTLMLVLGALLLLMGVGAAVLLARRWTLGPLRDLRDDVLALREGLPRTLPEERPYSELTDLARSFNELLEQRSPAPGDDASASSLDATVIRER
jgi:HAMP domain-containing protein